MMTKLTALAKKNVLLNAVIRSICLISLTCISWYKEIAGLLRSKGIGGKKYKSLIDYKNKHQGQRCFIICTGPSLTIFDLEKLKSEKTFGMNSLCKLYEQTSFRPTYYGIQDVEVYDKLKSTIEEYYSGQDNIFVADRIQRHFSMDPKWNIFPLNMAYNAYNRWFKNEFKVKYSDDVYKTVYDGFSITMSLIQLAIYMGFKEIYLIGADCNFLKSKKLHIAEHGVVDTTIDTSAERNLAGYKIVKEFAEINNIKIFNATRGGKLELFERVNLDYVI